MTVIDCEKTANFIGDWLKNYVVSNGLNGVVLGLSSGVDSALCALLCKRTGLPTLCVNMPCHSSETAYTRSLAFAQDYQLKLTTVNLSACHEHIVDQVKNENILNFNPNNLTAVGGLRSCLRTPVLSYFANATNSIIISTGNRSEDNIVRYFSKFGDGATDVGIISDLFKSEVYQLFQYLATPSDSDKMPKSAQDIYDAKPTADLWGPEAGQEDEKELGISYEEIEWADREDMRTAQANSINGKGIIFDENDPAKRPDFFRFTPRQQQVICKLHQMEKKSRHKINANMPVCRVRAAFGLVR